LFGDELREDILNALSQTDSLKVVCARRGVTRSTLSVTQRIAPVPN
jgi:hypothetical protein